MKNTMKCLGIIAVIARHGCRCLSALALIAGTLLVCNSCPIDGKPQPDKKGGPKVVVMNISQVTDDWGWLAVGNDKSCMFFNVDEDTGMPTLLYLKPPGNELENGITFFFKENGLPDIIEYNGYILYFDNFDGYTFDLAVIDPDGAVEYHYGIETDVNFDAWSEIAMPVSFVYSGSVYNGGRSIGDFLDNISVGLKVADIAIGIGTCVGTLFFPPLAVGCGIAVASAVAEATFCILEDNGVISETTANAGGYAIDTANAVYDGIECFGKKNPLDCVAFGVGAASIVVNAVGDAIDHFTDNKKPEVKAGMTPPADQARVSFYANGGSGTVPASQTVEKNTNIALPSGDGLSRNGYTFLGWNTSSVGNSYIAGGSYKITGNTSFYAVWYKIPDDVPKGVTAAAESADSIMVSWDPVSSAIAYYVYRGESAYGEYSRVETVWKPSTSYTDTGLSANTTYYYRVSYYTGPKESDKSSYASATTLSGVVVNIGYGMVSVPGGTFQLGKALGTASNNPDETPVSNVTLSGFYIGKYEVTQKEWKAVMGSLPSHFTSSSYSYGRGDAYPIYCVSWYDALVFCNKLSLMEGLTPAYRISNSVNPDNWGTVPTSSDAAWDAVTVVSGSTGYRLPTEAQWEYAAKGGNPSAPGWVGYIYAGSNTVGNVAWCDGINVPPTSDDRGTRVVGTKAPNFLGIYDMSGNVTEMCWDWIGDYTGEDKTNPTGASSGSQHVARGSCWYDAADSSYLRSVARGNASPYFRNNYLVGFRLARPQ